MTGGMAYEALNNAGGKKSNFIVILNDNKMSISHNVGAMSRAFTKLRSRKSYHKVKFAVSKLLLKIPLIGNPLNNLVFTVKETFKSFVYRNNIFTSMGLNYLGPVDGHDIESMEELFNIAKTYDRPTLIHVVTTKGKGYSHAENQPKNYHGVAPFDIEKGKCDSCQKTYSDIVGETLCELAESNDKICAVTAAMKEGTGLKNFASNFRTRFFDVGIAEQHAVTFSAGLAKNGMIPIFAVYSTFLRRGYDQLIHDVAMQNLHCIFAVDRAGIVGKDGETHQGVFDLSYFSHIPNLTVMAPSDGEELRKMLEFAVNECDGPVAIRYPRGKADFGYPSEILENGKGRILKDGKDAILIAIGSSTQDALEASYILEKQGISCAVIDARFLKPLDEKLILDYIDKCKVVGTVEENVSVGGLYSAVKAVTNREILCFSLPCEPIKHGSVMQIKEKYGIDGKSIAERIIKKLSEQVL
jgi:1-deoxy-D-xylulose-5-phosphate synthase